MDTQKHALWLERVEEIVNVLKGSSVSELELTEGDTEIVIRRSPDLVLTAAIPVPGSNQTTSKPSSNGKPTKVDTSTAIVAPLTGVYYSSSSPTTSPFVNIGDTIHTGQVIALIEAMKVFNEINAEISGRVVAIVPKSGDVVQKGDVLLKVETV